jgi:hypothetical protein
VLERDIEEKEEKYNCTQAMNFGRHYQDPENGRNGGYI